MQPEIDKVIRVCRFLRNDYYPKYDTWVRDKAFPGIMQGTRKILYIEKEGELVAASIIRLDKPKICCFKVDSVGDVDAIKLMLDILGIIDDPVITICEERLEAFDSFLKNFDFTLRQVEEGKYRIGKFEYVYKRGS